MCQHNSCSCEPARGTKTCELDNRTFSISKVQLQFVTVGYYYFENLKIKLLMICLFDYKDEEESRQHLDCQAPRGNVWQWYQAGHKPQGD